MFPALPLNYEHRPVGQEPSCDKSRDHLCECVLTQNHAACAHSSGQYEHEAEPPYGVEHEDEGESHECARYSTYGRCMGGYLPPCVDERAHNLYEQCRYEYANHEMRYVEQRHDVAACEVTHYGYDVRHGSPLLHSELMQGPSAVASVDTDEQCGRENGENVNQREHREFVLPWQQT